MPKISVDGVSKKFNNHLTCEDNSRLIFSGKFGIGKTYFLNKFFDDRADEYNKIIISPVHYVVSSNEDIFELIKADIIKELFLTGKIKLESFTQNTSLQNISSFIENNPLSLVKFMSKFLAKLDPIVEAPEKILDILGEIYKKYRSHVKDEENTNKTLSEELFEYLNDGEQKTGSIYENNYITKLINVFLREIKDSKKNVLIIDDIDRIDPEHIFRILNIFSAHNNSFYEGNKFLFDHLIIVCDKDNIQRIFEHRYGMNVDFDGYLDKFYSTDIFFYSNVDATKFYINTVLQSDDKGFNDFVRFLLDKLISIDSITIRKLLKHFYKPILDNEILYEQKGFKEEMIYLQEWPVFLGNNSQFFIETNDIVILNLFKLLSVIYGDFESFYACLSRLEMLKEEVDYNLIYDMISFLALQDHLVRKSEDDLFVTKYRDTNSQANFILGLNWPRTTYLNREFTINLKWNAGNKYDSSESYFKEAKAVDRSSITSYNGKSDISINVGAIFKSLNRIIFSCYEKGYLLKSDIRFRSK